MDNEETPAAPAEIPFLDHPETEEAGRRVLEALTREGDRGAMLVAGEMLSEFLGEALKSLNSDSLPPKDLKGLFSANGPLSSWSSRTRIAALVGLIDGRVYRSLERLRSLRNTAAHSEAEFSLSQHAAELHQALDLGPNFADGAFRLSREVVLREFIVNLKERGPKLEKELGVNPFERQEDILNILSERSDVIDALGEKAWRYQLGIGVWSLLGLMRIERDQHLEKVRVSRPRT